MMGVDYNGAGGIGIKVGPNEIKRVYASLNPENEENEDGEDLEIEEMLESILEDSEGIQHDTGGNSYTGDENYYIVVDAPFAHGVEKLLEKIENLKVVLKQKGFENYNKIDCHCDYHVW